MAKRFSLNDFINPQRKTQQTKMQMKFSTTASVSKTRQKTGRQRSPEETSLLIRTILKDIEQQQLEGKLVRNGKVWRYHI